MCTAVGGEDEVITAAVQKTKDSYHLGNVSHPIKNPRNYQETKNVTKKPVDKDHNLT